MLKSELEMLFRQRIDREIGKLEKKLNEFCNIQE
jgi:hypothetical protein